MNTIGRATRRAKAKGKRILVGLIACAAVALIATVLIPIVIGHLRST